MLHVAACTDRSALILHCRGFCERNAVQFKGEDTARVWGRERVHYIAPEQRVLSARQAICITHCWGVSFHCFFFFLLFFFVLATHGIVHFECGIVHYYAQVFCTRRETKCPSPRECVLRHYLRKLNTHNVKLIPCLFYFCELERIEILAHWFELWLYALLKSRLAMHTLVESTLSHAKGNRFSEDIWNLRDPLCHQLIKPSSNVIIIQLEVIDMVSLDQRNKTRLLKGLVCSNAIKNGVQHTQLQRISEKSSLEKCSLEKSSPIFFLFSCGGCRILHNIYQFVIIKIRQLW